MLVGYTTSYELIIFLISQIIFEKNIIEKNEDVFTPLFM